MRTKDLIKQLPLEAQEKYLLKLKEVKNKKKLKQIDSELENLQNQLSEIKGLDIRSITREIKKKADNIDLNKVDKVLRDKIQSDLGVLQRDFEKHENAIKSTISDNVDKLVDKLITLSEKDKKQLEEIDRTKKRITKLYESLETNVNFFETIIQKLQKTIDAQKENQEIKEVNIYAEIENLKQRLNDSEFIIVGDENIQVTKINDNGIKWKLDFVGKLKEQIIGIVKGTAQAMGNVFDTIILNTSYTPTGSEVTGTIYWDQDNHTYSAVLENGVVLQLGKEGHFWAVNKTGATIPNGTPVYISGAQGNRPTIAPCNGTDHIKSHCAGVTTEEIAHNDEGNVTFVGEVRTLDMSDYSEGDTLWVSKTVVGGFQNTEPTAPHHCDKIGTVTNNSHSVGVLLVNITSHKDLEDLANVDGSNPDATGDLLTWNQTLGVWERNAYNINDYALTSDLHSPVTVTDSSTIDFTLTGQNITASVIESGLTGFIRKSPTSISDNTITIFNNTFKGLVIKGASGQTGYLFELQNSAGNSIFRFNGNGDIITDRWLNDNGSVYIGNSVAGAGTLSHTTGAEGYNNTCVGQGTGFSLTTGYANTLLGRLAGYDITTGYQNAACGGSCLANLTTGYNNFAGGYNSLANITIEANNVGVGVLTGNSLASSNNFALGYYCFSNATNLVTGAYNIGIGSICGQKMSGASQRNILLGYYTFGHPSTDHVGSDNVMIGYASGFNPTGTNNNNTLIGFQAGYNGRLVNSSGNVWIGYNVGNNNAFNGLSNTLIIANSNTATPLIYGLFSGTGAGITINSQNANGIPLIVKGITSQVSNLQEWQSSSGSQLAYVTPLGGAVFNEQGNDVDFRIEGDTITDLLFTDASTDAVKFGGIIYRTKSTHTGNATLDVKVYSHKCNSATSFTLTIPNGTVDTQEIRIRNVNTGTVTLSGSIGVSGVKTLAQGETIVLEWDSTDSEWQ